MEQKQYTYTIGGKTYIQKPLVLGQVNQLMAVLRGTSFPQTDDMFVLVSALGNKLPMALAIVLIPSPPEGEGWGEGGLGRYLMDRDLKAIADELEFSIDPVTPLQVADDFFDCNPIVSLLEKFGALGTKLRSRIETAKLGSIKSPSSSPAETSPGATA